MPPKKKYQKKRQFNKKRQYRNRMPRREVKRREHAEIAIRNTDGGLGVTFSPFYPDPTKPTPISSSTAMSLMPIRSFYRVSKGTRPNQMIGNEIFSKSLYLKGKVTGLPANNSVESFVYWGWVQDKLSITDFTTPTVGAATRTDLEDFIVSQVKQHFDNPKDEMRYREKKKDNIKIVGVRKLQHKEDASYNDEVDFKCSWRTNRKVVYTSCYDPTFLNGAPVGSTSTAVAGSNYCLVSNGTQGSVADINVTDTHDDVQSNSPALAGDIGQLLPLNNWLPFALVFTPKYADISPGTIQIQYNDIHYFQG